MMQTQLWTPPEKRIAMPPAIGNMATGMIMSGLGGAVNSTPAGIPNLAFWFRGDLGIIPNGGNASGWNDQSGNGLHISQSTPAAQPAIVTNWKNGINALSFDGTDDVLARSTGFFGAGTPLTIFVVGRSPVDPDAVDVGTNTMPWVGVISTSGNDALFITRFNGANRFVASTGAAAVNLTVGTLGIGTNPAYMCWGTDGSGGGANLTFRANGLAKTTSGGLGDTTFGSSMLTIGNGSAFTAKTIGETFGFTRLLSAGEIAQMEAYILGFWGAF